MKTTRYFKSGDRYEFDFGMCSTANGYGQVDTPQDAFYFGTWASPYERKIVTYCEGDVTILEAETDEEFVQELQNIADWNEKNQGKPARIDPGLKPELAEAFRKIGAGSLLWGAS